MLIERLSGYRRRSIVPIAACDVQAHMLLGELLVRIM